jgi:hypothetical protein
MIVVISLIFNLLKKVVATFSKTLDWINMSQPLKKLGYATRRSLAWNSVVNMFRGCLFLPMAFLSLSRSKKLVRVILLYVPSLEYLYPTESDLTECQIKAVNKNLVWTIEEPLDPRGPVSPLSLSPRRVADQKKLPLVSGDSLARRRKTNATLRYLSS